MLKEGLYVYVPLVDDNHRRGRPEAGRNIPRGADQGQVAGCRAWRRCAFRRDSPRGGSEQLLVCFLLERLETSWIMTDPGRDTWERKCDQL
jgi:hypothetical protein